MDDVLGVRHQAARLFNRLAHHFVRAADIAQTGSQNTSQRRLRFEIGNHRVVDTVLFVFADHALQQAVGEYLRAAQGDQTFDNQCDGNNRREQQGPDWPASS